MPIPNALEARQSFGLLIKIWFARNNWPQDVPHKLSEFMTTGGPWNSQISTAIGAKLDPKVGFFLACGEFNEVVAKQRFTGVTNQRLVVMLKGATPILNDDGTVFNASNFFDLFTGRIAIPLDFQIPDLPELSDVEAHEICEQMRADFLKGAKTQMLNPAEAWRSLAKTLGHIPDDTVERFKEVLSGWGDFTAEDLSSLPSSESHSPYAVTAALFNWRKALDETEPEMAI